MLAKGSAGCWHGPARKKPATWEPELTQYQSHTEHTSLQCGSIDELSADLVFSILSISKFQY